MLTFGYHAGIWHLLASAQLEEGRIQTAVTLCGSIIRPLRLAWWSVERLDGEICPACNDSLSYP